MQCVVVHVTGYATCITNEKNSHESCSVIENFIIKDYY